MKKIIISLLFAVSALFTSVEANAQIIPKLTGVVLEGNSYGEPVIGATVCVKEKPGHATTTDMVGHFTLYVVYGSRTLRISNFGYKTQDVPIKGQSAIMIYLEPEDNSLSSQPYWDNCIFDDTDSNNDEE